MAYKKQTWVDEETIINAERMSHIEDGLAYNLIVIEEGDDDLDVQYIKDAIREHDATVISKASVFDEALSHIYSYGYDYDAEEGLYFKYFYMSSSETLTYRFRCLYWDGNWGEPTEINFTLQQSGAEDFVVTFSGSTSGGDAAVDKTLQEINEAFLAGKIIKLRYDDRGGSIYELQKMYSATDGRIITLDGAYYDYERYAIHCNIGAPDILFIEYEEY